MDYNGLKGVEEPGFPRLPWTQENAGSNPATLTKYMRVQKKSGKPFKSGRKVNTVKSITENPYCGKPGYTFFEDDSVVNCELCEIASKYRTMYDQHLYGPHAEETVVY